LINEEYTVFKSASDFLKEYGGLIIQFENPKRLNSYLPLSLNLIDAGNDDFLILLGDNFYQAFHNIISGVELEIMSIEDE